MAAQKHAIHKYVNTTLSLTCFANLQTSFTFSRWWEEITRPIFFYCKNINVKYFLPFHFISLTLFSVGLTNSYSKITNKYQLKQKYKISIDFKIDV